MKITNNYKLTKKNIIMFNIIKFMNYNKYHNKLIILFKYL